MILTSVFKAFYFDGESPKKISGELRVYKNGMEFIYEDKLLSMSYKDFILKEDYDFLWFENNETGERIATSLKNKDKIKKIVPSFKFEYIDQIKASVKPLLYFLCFVVITFSIYSYSLRHNLFGTTDLLLSQAKKSLKVCSPSHDFKNLSRRAVLTLDNGSDDIEVLISKVKIKNAFAFPGKKIIFTQKALKELKNEKEFLGVLAHEVSHIKLKHIDSASNVTQILISTFGGALKFASYFAFSAYSREREKAADLNAIKLLKQSNLPSDGLLTFIETLDPLYKSKDKKSKKEEDKKGTSNYSKYIEYFSTHPLQSRTTYLKNLTSSKPKRSLFSAEEFMTIKDGGCRK